MTLFYPTVISLLYTHSPCVGLPDFPNKNSGHSVKGEFWVSNETKFVVYKYVPKYCMGYTYTKKNVWLFIQNSHVSERAVFYLAAPISVRCDQL